MANVYQFSQSSLKLFKECIDVAHHPDPKWNALFRPNSTLIAVKQENNLSSDDNTIVESPRTFTELNSTQQTKELAHNPEEIEKKKVERIVATIETEPFNKIQFLSEQFDHSLIPAVAEMLSVISLERICEQLLESKNFNEDIFNHFVPVFIVKGSQSISLNLITQTYKTNPIVVLTLMENLFIKIEQEACTKIVEEFFATVPSASSRFLRIISAKELPTDVFIHHMKALNQLYKISEKTNDIQEFLFKVLTETSEFCRKDKTYGRCMLTVFQSLKRGGQFNRQALDYLLSSHETPFKRSCQNIVQNLYIDQD